ncbi:receptor-like protein 12 [Cryptomeria japonica]|uniref:receptor-like protein 12 n=1 Tax=Cryptomeria japonica TaxID=3369 RepID=UPI0027D9DA0B|nr:receptor-like protein 12 [Cryptomeria japonica]
MYPLSFKMSVGCGSFLMWIIILQAHFSFSAACIKHERKFLLDFKAGLDLSSGRLSSWRGLNCCEWEGVACDYHTSHVIRLNLNNDWYHHWLSGELHPSLFNLRHLQHLDLTRIDFKDNTIVGNLPSWLWDLPNLIFVNLSNNMLEGSLPRKISHTFRTVDLHGNGLYGSLPALDFFSYFLDLSDNEFTGSIPETNDALEILNFSNNKLTGMIPRSIGSCSSLSVLNLAQNVLQREIPGELGNLKALRTLNLNDNSLQGRVPSSIAKCIKLRVLDLGNNNFEGSLPIWIEKMVDLRILSLASNKFKGEGPSSLEPDPPLANLQLCPDLSLMLHSQSAGWAPLAGVVDTCNAVLHEAPSHLKIPHETSNLDSLNKDPKTDVVGPLPGEAQASTWKGALVGITKSRSPTLLPKVTVGEDGLEICLPDSIMDNIASSLHL